MNNFLRGFGNFKKNENGITEYVDYLGTKYTFDPTTKRWKSNGQVLNEQQLQNQLLSNQEGFDATDVGDESGGNNRRISPIQENYSSITFGYSNVVFYTTADGTVNYLIGINPDPSIIDSQIGDGIVNVTPDYDTGVGGADLTPPANIGKCKQIVVGYRNATALRTDGTVISWGNSEIIDQTENFMKQLQYYQQPGRRLENVTITKIAAGANHVVALLSNGEVVAWGGNRENQLSDPDTVLTDIGLIPRPVQGDNLYITDWENYVSFKYGQTLSSYLDTFNNSSEIQVNDCVDPDGTFPTTQRRYRFLGAGCTFHDGENYNQSYPEGGYDSPYILNVGLPGQTYYPRVINGSFAWANVLNWNPDTGAPNDYQFSRETIGQTYSVNYSYNGGWTKSAENIPMVQDNGSISYGYTGSSGVISPNSLFGTSNNTYSDIAAGRSHTLLLTTDGTIETWGWNWYYVVTGSGSQQNNGSNIYSRVGSGNGTIPYGDNTAPTVKILKTTTNSVDKIACSYYNSYVVKSDGTLFAWDRNELGESLPIVNSDGTSGLPTGPFIQVDGGYHHAIALREDGTVVAWGEVADGKINVPAILKNPATANCVAVGAMVRASFALRENGDLYFWGNDDPVYGFGGFTSGSIINPSNPIFISS